MPYTNIVRHAITVTMLSLVLRWLWKASASSNAQLESGNYVFPPPRAVRLLMLLVGVVFAALSLVSLYFLDRSGGRWALGFFLGFLLLVMLSYPPVLSIEVDGVRSRTWYGREKKLRWEEISALQYNVGNRCFTVRGVDGCKITHSGFNADAVFFREEIQRRTRLPMRVKRPGVWKPEIVEVGFNETEDQGPQE
jgi:hypothetical protein